MAESINIKYNSTWAGYQNYQDITNSDPNKLQPGSQNTFIQDGDRLEPRAGITYFGAAGTDLDTVDSYWCPAGRIHSKYDDFITVQGIKVPLRVYYSGHSGIGDVIQAWLPTNGDPTSTVKSWVDVTPGVAGGVGPVLSTHRYFFDQWWDRINLLSRAIFTMGNTNIWTWSGGFAPVISHTANTITTDAIWSTKGFIDAPEGNPRITVNGVEYTVTAGFGTNTITVTTTAGINDGDLVLHGVQADDTLSGATIYDVCGTLNNQVYYLDWRQRNCYVSWNRNQDGFIDPTQTIFTGSGIDDAFFSGDYDSDANATFRVTVTDSVPVDFNSPNKKGLTTFTGSGANALTFDTLSYTETDNNTYRVVVSNNVAAFFQGTMYYENSSAGFWTGEGFTAPGGDTGTICYDDLNGEIGATFNDPPEVGEVITGDDSGSTATVIRVGGLSQNNFVNLSYTVFKNDNAITSGNLQNSVGEPIAGSVIMTDGITFNIDQNLIGNSYPSGITNGVFNSYDGALNAGDSWTLIMGANDKVTRYKNNNVVGSQNVSVPTGGGTLTMSDGISIEFTTEIGHDVGDAWTIFAQRRVRKGWTVFTYTSPGRLPGEGFQLLLDSNGWTLKPQEDKMYINAQAGHYYQVDLNLSSDLLNENLEIKRLKSEPQNKVLFPYLIGYDKNFLAGISQDKTYDNLGRQELLELPQTRSISDEVRIDFETANWENGDFLYGFRKLFFSVPESGKMFVWDDYKKYWHSPMVFSNRVGLISIIDGVLCGHSYERNETYELFSGTSDLDVFPIETRMVFAYDSFDKRYFQKTCSAVGFEGYISGAPVIDYVVNADVGGCHGQATGTILPFMCAPQDRASLGASHLGYHGLANDPVEMIPHFFFIDTFDNNKMNFYQRNIELSCNSLDQRWSIISVGTNADMSSENNTTIVHRKTL
jgi:hypothetical protein